MTITVSPTYVGPGTYTVTATLVAPATTTFPDGTTAPKSIPVTVAAALGYQSGNPEAPCYLVETTPPTTATTTPTPQPQSGEVAATCTGSVPFLSYSVEAQGLPAGATVDITFLNPSGANVSFANQPLSGTLLWPGASATPPLMWPGWDLLADGTYVDVGESNFGWTRPSVDIRFAVTAATPSGRVVLSPAAPVAVETVTYPPESSTCANPQNLSPVALTDETGAEAEAAALTQAVPTAVNAGLAGEAASTGSGHLGGWLVGAGLALVALSIIVLFAGRTR